MKLFLTAISYVFIFPISAQQVAAIDKIKDILDKTEMQNKEIKTLQYNGKVITYRPGEDDSVSIFTGSVWLAQLESDSIFGYKLHVEGKRDFGDYDYYYDGTKSYELMHKQKQIQITNPYAYPNNERNPSKTRTALVPLLYLLTDTRLTSTLLKNNPAQSILENNEHFIIKLSYPKDQFGQTAEKKIFILKKSFRIERVRINIDWNGTIYITDHIISNYIKNQPILPEMLSLKSDYSNYEVKLKPDIKEVKKRQENPHSSFIGISAPDFEYSSLAGGKKIRLSALKGKYILLDFWETWCGYCILSIPKKKELFNRFSPDLFSMLSISTENKRLVEKIINVNDLKYPNLFGDPQILKDYQVEARPQYVLINPEGKIITVSAGNLDEVIDKLESLIKSR